jgi:hypothetical protein
MVNCSFFTAFKAKDAPIPQDASFLESKGHSRASGVLAKVPTIQEIE